MKKIANILIYSRRRVSFKSTFIPLELEPGVFPFPKRQIPLEGKRTWSDRINEINEAKSRQKYDFVNIGLEIPKETLKFTKRISPELRNLAKEKNLNIDLDKVDNSTQQSNEGILQRYEILSHFNIFEDLFTYPHIFYPIQNFHVSYNSGEDNEVDVYNGNLLFPFIAKDVPNITIDSPSEHLFTLVMTSPDEHLEENNKEYVHWIISNILPEEKSQLVGDVNVPYLQPIPYLGTGFHRYVFTLYRQDCSGKIDLSKYSQLDSGRLEDRTFSSYEFLRDNQDVITPVGLCFFQAAWDNSVRNCFRERLGCLEPIFEYVWPQEKLPPQKEFPQGEVLHHYYDRYRDVKDVQEEVLRERLQNVDPFRPPKKLEFPLAVPEDEQEIRWVAMRNREKKLRRGQWRGLDAVDADDD